jgi:hypothetical protein
MMSCWSTLRIRIPTPLSLPSPPSPSLSAHVVIVISSLSPVPNPLPLQRAAHPFVKRRCLWPDEMRTSYMTGHDLSMSSLTYSAHLCTSWFFLYRADRNRGSCTLWSDDFIIPWGADSSTQPSQAQRTCRSLSIAAGTCIFRKYVRFVSFRKIVACIGVFLFFFFGEVFFPQRSRRSRDNKKNERKRRVRLWMDFQPTDGFTPWSKEHLFSSLSLFNFFRVLLEHTRVSDKVFSVLLFGLTFAKQSKRKKHKETDVCIFVFCQICCLLFEDQENERPRTAPSPLLNERKCTKSLRRGSRLRLSLIANNTGEGSDDASGGTSRSSGKACYQKLFLVQRTVNRDPLGFFATFVLSLEVPKTLRRPFFFKTYQRRSCPADADFFPFVINFTHMQRYMTYISVMETECLPRSLSQTYQAACPCSRLLESAPQGSGSRCRSR